MPDSARSSTTAPRSSAWFERWLTLRDRLLASPLFQRRAAAFALTRPMAQRRARGLFDLVAGFVYSQVLLACVRLRLFDTLAASGPLTLDQAAARLGLAADATQRLLDAAVSLKLLQRRSGGRYGLGPLGAPLVGNTAIAAMVEHHTALYADLADPVALLRATPAQRRSDNALAGYWAYDEALQPPGLAPDGAAEQRVATYTALMAASQPLVAEQVLAAYPFARHRCLLDVGGGDGRFVTSVAAHVPSLRLMLFDLPGVAAKAEQRLARAGLASRSSVFGGSFFEGALPQGADIVTLLRVVHDHDDAAALQILHAVHAALPPGGTLLLAEPMARTGGAEAMGDAYFGFYLLAMGRGRPRSRSELTALLQQAGFNDVRAPRTSLPLQTQVLIGRRCR